MMDIRTRLTYQFVALVTFILILFSLGVYFFSKLYLEKRFFKRLQDRAVTTTTLIFDLQQADSTVLRLIDATDQQSLLNENISVYRGHRKELIFSTNPANAQLHEQVVAQLDSTAQTQFFRQNGYQLVALRLAGGKSRNWVLVSGVDAVGNEALLDLRKILLTMVLAAIFLLGVAGRLFANRALAPMSDVVRQVSTIFPANLDRRVTHPNQSDEIGVLVTTFNELLDRVEQAIRTQKMFIANISHELKNPLTKINSQIDVALLKPRNPNLYEQTLRSLQEDTRSLTQFTTTLLELANTSIQANDLLFEPVRIDELLWEVKKRLQHWHNDYSIELSFPDFPEEEEALMTMGNQASLSVLFTNLIDNACKFSPVKTAQVDFRSAGKTMTIAVHNEGPQIPKADLPYLFQPFFRSDATAQSSKGHGVGLAIAEQIVHLHKGTIAVVSTPKRTTFTLVLPAVQSL